MSDLLKALQIFLKYGDPKHPTHCEHDLLMVCVDPDLVSNEDKAALKELSFKPDGCDPCFTSHRFGSG